jgi:hypothetical protein
LQRTIRAQQEKEEARTQFRAKQENQLLAKERIVVEHVICGMKRYRILSDRLRTHDAILYNVILDICAGLWNFHLTH